MPELCPRVDITLGARGVLGKGFMEECAKGAERMCGLLAVKTVLVPVDHVLVSL